MAAVIPKGFDLLPDADQPVPDSRLPSGGPEGWVVDSPEVVAELEGPSVPPGGEVQWGTWSDGRPKIRRAAPDGTYFDGTYDENGTWSMVSEISGDMEAPPEGFDPLPTDLPYGEGEQGEQSDGSELLDDEEVTQPQVSGGRAAWRGMQSGALFGFDDELAAGAGALGNKVGQWLGMNDTEIPMGEVYRQILDEERDQKDAAYDQHRLLYGAGFLPGAIISAPLTSVRAPAAISSRLSPLGTRLAEASAMGAKGGALSGMGNNEGDLGDLAANTLEGGGIGAVAGPLAYPVVAGVSRTGSAIKDVIMPRNTLDSGLEQLVRRAPQEAGAMRGRADEMVRAGVPPRLVDVVDEAGRRTIRAGAGRATGASEDLARHADSVYVDAQDRVAQQARNVISNEPGTARQLGHQIAEEQRAMGPAFDAVRGNNVTMTPELLRAFSTAEGRSVLRTVGRYMTPDEQAQLNAFVSNVNSIARQVDPRLPPAVRQQIEAQLMRDTPLTVDIADKFARLITQRAGENPAMARVAADYADTVRGAARAQYPEYSAALDDFAARARVGDAAAGTGRYEDTSFLNAPADEYARAVAGANQAPAAAGGTLSEADALAMRARDEVVDRATAGSGAGATGVARQISRGGSQRTRNEALLGPDRAERLAQGMGAEVRRVDNTRFIDPRTGSQTSGRDQDLVDAGFDATMNAASGGKWAAVRAAANFVRNAGVRGVDAERLVRDAIDPTRTRAAILYLEERGMARDQATRLMQAIAGNLGGRAGGTASYDQPAEPRTSIRSIANKSRELNQGAEQ